MKPKALFVHDCSKCQYLGTMFVPFRNTVADVYRSCGKDIPAVIFRYSDDGPDYTHHHINRMKESDIGWLFKTREELNIK